MTIEILNSVIAGLSALATIGICTIAFYQLKGLRNNITLQIVSDMERELYERKKALDSASTELWRLSLNPISEELIEILKLKLSMAGEDYFNAVERLAFLILKKHLDERNWKSQYKDLIFDIVEQNENIFGITTPYTNIVALYGKWKKT
ncbi:hypothetical protein P0082_01185 [Candidatus Haliotispira prima]|uniref:Uncharacterized protein n=1 Tax=Candidatus Haliotispira prima TaxID=3034016 RepID=A0ABY8MJX7_9SPIO|nr:hypothetical protein P0082_01185 [Candidatus Haliotispira prima]